MNKAETVLVDCADQDIKGKELNLEHAKRLFKLQHTTNRNDWTLTEGQNLELKNGDLIKSADTGNSSKGRKTGRT